jgi:hypothetical protein
VIDQVSSKMLAIGIILRPQLSQEVLAVRLSVFGVIPINLNTDFLCKGWLDIVGKSFQ